ncbi:MAG: hypothetical protein K2J99_10700, partial [Lachnospiraceae bacterium]|nr:hypothetical protein [Lachnospiraceae bacterium]
AYRKSGYIGETFIDEEDRMRFNRYEVIDYSYGEESLGDLSLNIDSDILNEVVMNWYMASFSSANYTVTDYIKNNCIMAKNAVEELYKIVMPIELDVDQERAYFSDIVNMAA